MSNLFLIRLSGSTVLAPFPRRLCRETSESRRRPVVVPDAVLGNYFNTGGGSEIIFAGYRTISHTPITSKIMHEARLRHASTQFSSRNTLTATQIQRTINRVNSEGSRE